MNDCPVYLCSNGLYWQARWRASNSMRRTKSLGPKSKLSKRSAVVLCRRMAREMSLSPARRDCKQSPLLDSYLTSYQQHRTDVSDATLALHAKTGQYIRFHFGDSIRIDKITRVDAREWRTSLYDLGIKEATVCGHVRNAKVIFNLAVADEIIEFNPFDRLKGTPPKPVKDWKYIDRGTLNKLMDACPNNGWRTLLGLCRLAGLRQQEALSLRWVDIDVKGGRMKVNAEIQHETTKKRKRVVPIDPPKVDPGLMGILNEAYPEIDEICYRVIQNIGSTNLWRDFQAIAKRAGVEPYDKWCHTLRKNCETDWAQHYPQYVVSSLMGHDISVSQDHYLQVPEDVFSGPNATKETQSRLGIL